MEHRLRRIGKACVLLCLLLPACLPANPAPPVVSGATPGVTPAASETAAPTATAAGTPAPAPTATGAPSPSATPLPPLPVLNVPVPAGSAAQSAGRLASQLAAAATVDDAYPAVVQALAWGGIAVYDSNGNLMAQPLAPASDLRLFDFQAYGLATDDVNHGGLTLDELAQALAEAQTTVDDAPVTADLLERLLAAWVPRAGALDETSWEAFTPLFLAQSARLKSPAVDVRQRGYAAADLRLSGLELALFLGAHVRNGRPVPGRLAALPARQGLAAPAGDNPCGLLQTILEDVYGKWLTGGIDSQTGDALGEAWGEAAKAVGGLVGKGMKWAGTGFGWAMTAVGILASQTAWTFTIEPDPTLAHYKHDESNDVVAYFKATVDVNEKWPQWFADCAKLIGKELPDKGNMSSNKIRWVPLYGMPEHATVSSDGFDTSASGGGGRLEMNFDASGNAQIKIIMSQEKDQAWKTGIVKHDHITMKGELFRDNGLPGAESFIGALGGNPAGASVPVLKKWWDKWFPMTAYGRMEVEWHAIVPMVFRQQGISGGIPWTMIGYNCKGLYGAWQISITQSGVLPGGYANVVGGGDISASLPESGSGPLSGSWESSLQVKNAPAGASVKATFSGTLSLGGTKDAPTLSMKVDKVQADAGSYGPGMRLELPFQGPGGAPIGAAPKPEPDFPKCK